MKNLKELISEGDFIRSNWIDLLIPIAIFGGLFLGSFLVIGTINGFNLVSSILSIISMVLSAAFAVAGIMISEYLPFFNPVLFWIRRHWYRVDISQLTSPRYKMVDWVKENTEGFWCTINNDSCFYFSQESDAVLFRMTWE